MQVWTVFPQASVVWAYALLTGLPDKTPDRTRQVSVPGPAVVHATVAPGSRSRRTPPGARARGQRRVPEK
ncbi:hypothetical protein GCM10018793_41550 [Streptomyces sulfonofaciens]|uniref:Uncharacterized protein n=1 Tax=Streptomyces sulfonofaciens TaxID=68272 RepID=A0A919GDV7_9ACTN|nr:hypothetical protein GCM10018793_41550 [Streptomyces sulfonofaciens]